MATREEFIAAARAATIYVNEKLVLGPSNPLKGEASKELKDVVDQSMMEQKHAALWLDGKSQAALIGVRAAIAANNKAGNCGGMACVAFHYIHMQMPDIRPMSYVSTPNNNPYGALGDSHAFLAFNLPADPSPVIGFWGDEVIVCDPWMAWNARQMGAGTADEKGGVFLPANEYDEWVNEAGYSRSGCIVEHTES